MTEGRADPVGPTPCSSEHGFPADRASPPEPAALAEPTAPARGRWVALLTSANLGLWMAFFTPIQVLLAQQVAAIDAAGKVGALGWVTGVGAAVAIVANPLAGAASDRTTSRFGRRHPWTLGGALLGSVALVALSQQSTLLGVALCWVLAQSCLNAMLASLTAAIPDHVPVRQRGFVSAWAGLPQPLGLVLGVVLVTLVVPGLVIGYATVAALLVLLALPFVLATADPRLPRTHRPAVSWRAVVAGLWVSPRRHPDFAWAWCTRFAVQLANSLGTLYLLYFLIDVVRYERVFPGRRAEDGLLVLILIYTGALLATTVVAGRASDRSGRRKVFVVGSGAVMTVAALLLAMWQSWATAIVAAGVLGAGYGAYVSVDQALTTQVLPVAGDRAKDLGVINIANSAPQVLAPALAAPVVAYLGGYPALYGLAAAVTVAGALLVLPIRAVR